MKMIFVIDYAETWMDVWPRRVYCQFPGQIDGFLPLAEIIDTDRLTGCHRLCIAKEITRLFHTLHAKNMVQNDVKVDDVYVRVLDEVGNCVCIDLNYTDVNQNA